jgi:hypothetical protein
MNAARVHPARILVAYTMTTAICFPVLYIVQVLMGARLDFSQALALNGILLASSPPLPSSLS